MMIMGLMSVLIMFIANFLISYGVMSNLMIDQFDHSYNHLNKVYMGLFMASSMGLIGLYIMPPVTNYFLELSVGFLSLMILMAIFIRNQTFISDSQYVKGMIEHHSAALLMAKQSNTKTLNPKILKMNEDMIKMQHHEIQMMQSLLN
jgi:uncharacterized protein (DUF305 family)